MGSAGVISGSLETKVRAVVRDVRRDEPMARHVQFRIGGPADLLIVPRDLGELQAVVEVLFGERERPIILGQGSNVLIGDRGIRGVVIKLGKGVDRVQMHDTSVSAEAGAGLPAVALRTAKAGLAGLEFAAGIPGSIGGAVVMNAGAHGHEMAEVVQAVDLLTPEGTRRLDGRALEFTYRGSAAQTQPWIVARAVLRLRREDPASVRKRLDTWLAQRGATQPIGPPSTGCIFRNPPGDHAGRLIDQSGMKGEAVGGARVSTLHANYIINDGRAQASDVLALAGKVRQRVAEQTGVTLEMEVKLLGEF